MRTMLKAKKGFHRRHFFFIALLEVWGNIDIMKLHQSNAIEALINSCLRQRTVEYKVTFGERFVDH